MKIEERLIRLNESLRIFKSSPQLQVTYADLANLYEDLIDILDELGHKHIGFK